MPTLNWLTREEDDRAAGRPPYQFLEKLPDLSVGDRGAGNMLIQGDNLEVLKALLPFCAGRSLDNCGKTSIVAGLRPSRKRP